MKPSFVRLVNATVLSRAEIAAEVKIINQLLPKQHWSVKITDSSSELRGNYRVKNFAKTWEFLNMIALHALKLRHHPTITTTYNEIDLIITTHDQGNQVTGLDIKLAQAIQNSFANNIVEKVDITKVVPDMRASKASKIIDELTRKSKTG